MSLTSIFVIAVFALVGVTFVLGTVADKKRRDAWRGVAADLGLTYHEKANHLLEKHGSLKYFGKGHSQSLTNVIVSDAGDVQIILGDYSFGTGGTRNMKSYSQTICIVTADALLLPHCFLRPAVRLFDFLGGLVSWRDLHFNDDPAFSAAYRLQAEDEDAARALFDPRTRAWFTARAGQYFHFESAGDTLMFHSSRRVEAEQVRELLGQALQVKNLMARQIVAFSS
jgi:hypothetical protein